MPPDETDPNLPQLAQISRAISHVYKVKLGRAAPRRAATGWDWGATRLNAPPTDTPSLHLADRGTLPDAGSRPLASTAACQRYSPDSQGLTIAQTPHR